jgi:hypothetical protein
MLFPVFKPPLTTAVGLAIVIPVIASFLWDGLITTGVMRVGSRWHNRIVALFSQWGRRYLPGALHLVLGAGTGWFVFTELQVPPALSPTGVLQYILLGGLVLAGVLSAVDIGRWRSALVVLVAGAFLSLVVGISLPQMTITTAGFLLLLTRLGNRRPKNNDPTENAD